MEGYIYLKKTNSEGNEKIKIETSIENPLKYLKPVVLIRVKNMEDVKNKLILFFNNKYDFDKSKNEYNGILIEMINDFIKICREKFDLIENEDNSFIPSFNKNIKDNLYCQGHICSINKINNDK